MALCIRSGVVGLDPPHRVAKMLLAFQRYGLLGGSITAAALRHAAQPPAQPNPDPLFTPSLREDPTLRSPAHRIGTASLLTCLDAEGGYLSVA